MRNRTKRWIKGSISVLLIIILVPVMSFAAIIVDTGRINMARSMVSSAGDLAGNSALADYDTVLKDVYGLFAVSQSEDQLAENVKQYFVDTLVSNGVVGKGEADQYVENLMGDFRVLISLNGEDPSENVANFLSMSLDDGEGGFVFNNELAGASLANPNILRQQIIEYEKYRAPVSLGMSFFDSLTAFKNVEKQMEVVEKQTEAAEQTQQVASVSKQLITDIRAFDDMIDAINTPAGEDRVKGWQIPDSDMVYILPKLDDRRNPWMKAYAEQVLHYGEDWGNNGSNSLEYITQMACVFLLNDKSTTISNYYLYSLNSDYIQSDGTIQYYENVAESQRVKNAESDIVRISLLSDAENKLDNKIKDMDSSLSVAGKYESRFLRELSGNEFTKKDDSDKAMDEFISYQKFLKDKNGNDLTNYSQAQEIIEKLYVLQKYYMKYEEISDNDIGEKESEVETARAKVSSQKSTDVGIANKIQSKLTVANNYKNGLTGYTDVNDNVKAILDETAGEPDFAMPGQNEDGYFDFSGVTYSTTSNIFDVAYNNIIKENFSGEEKKIIQGAKDYRDSFGKSFAEYMKELDAYKETWNQVELYQILRDLSDADDALDEADTNVTSYKSNYQITYAAYIDQEKNAQKTLDTAKEKQTELKERFENCTKQFQTFASNYQEDLRAYETYVSCAKNTVNGKTKKIREQYGKIQSNIEKLYNQLDIIYSDCEAVGLEIQLYDEKVDAWETSNNAYKTAGGEDSFYTQSDTDIDASRSEYNITSLRNLEAVVDSWRSEYDGFNEYLKSTQIRYGDSNLASLESSDIIVKMLQDYYFGSEQSAEIIEKEKAESAYEKVYVQEAYTEFEIGRENELKFLNPNVLSIEILVYMNESFPRNNDGVKTEKYVGTKTNEDVNKEYNSIKAGFSAEKKTDDTDDEESSDEGGDDTKESEDGDELTGGSNATSSTYGYTYKSIANITDMLPSNGKVGETSVTTTEFSLGEEKKTDARGNTNDSINASKSIGSQKSVLSTMLSGLNKMGTNMLEDAYILDYIFENFSYNTMVQEMTVEGAKIDNYANALTKVETESKNYQYKANTQSNYTICAGNNYLHGAEIEYILYGSKVPSTNVAYAKAGIYAVRFGFNCVFAFTDNEIRNMARGVGLAVQAMSCGIVPYQIPMVITQLALAAAESAIDLSQMSLGLKVPIVKTSQTWVMSVTGATQMGKDIIAAEATKAAGEVSDAISGVVNDKVSNVSSRLQGLVDASADEMKDVLTGMSDDLEKATNAQAEELANSAVNVIQAKLEAVLNNIQYIEYSEFRDDELPKLIDQAFEGVEEDITTALASYGGTEIGEKIVEIASDVAKKQMGLLKKQVKDTLENCTAKQAGQKIMQQINQIKADLLSRLTAQIAEIKKGVNEVVSTVVGNAKKELNGYIKQCEKGISEKVATEIKGKVTESTNRFVREALSNGNSTGTIGNGVSGGTATTSSSLASSIKFGYKDYLMLFTYIALLANDEPILTRTADVIQLNMMYAKGKPDGDNVEGKYFVHKKSVAKINAQNGETPFSMMNAATYVTIEANVKLDMLFLNMDFFTSILDDDTTSVSGQMSSIATIEYKGLFGY